MEITNQRFGSSGASARSEDGPLISGNGRFTDDIALAEQTHAVFVRSVLAHAEINGIDLTVAQAMPGVHMILTANDLEADGVGPIPPLVLLPGRDGTQMYGPALPALAKGRVRYVGEPIAVVVAETEAQARDAAEAVEVDLAQLPNASHVARALQADAPQIWPDAPGNISLDWEDGDGDAAAAALDAAAHVTRVRLHDSRVAPSPMEPRAAIARWSERDGSYTLTAGTQGVAVVRNLIAEHALKVPREKVRVITPDVGGGFGMKVQAYSEYVAILVAARRLDRPVRWCATRSEGFLSDTHGRDGLLEGEMAVDADGRILALLVRTWVGIGAYASTYVSVIATNNTKNCLSSVYQIPIIHCRVRMVFTNASPLGPYRGAGRPEAIYLIERLMDKTATEMGIDRIELRRRNMIPPTAIPYHAPNSPVYDSGDFEAVMDKALDLADWQGFEARRAASERGGRLRGIGVSCFLEVSGGSPLQETADLRFDDDGKVSLRTGAQAMGQGQMTVMPFIVANRLGIDRANVRIIQGDSFEVPDGLPTVASRSTMMAGGAMIRACEEAIEKGLRLAEQELEVGAEDLEYKDGSFRVIGTDRHIPILELAQLARSGAIGGDEPADSLDTVATFTSQHMSFPNGCHVCEVEIDPQTGSVRVVAYHAVDDVGTILHQTIVEGQIHGGVAQGLGQVLGEEVVYSEDGQLQTGSFMDYMMPRADDLPPIVTGHHTAVCTTNPLGVKGAGESGVAGSLPSAVNAVLDALASRGVAHLDLPMTPDRVWKALQEAQNM